jgi:ComEC/Rec2-related protein
LAAAGMAAALGVIFLHVDACGLRRAGLLALGACLGFVSGFIAVERMRQATDGKLIPLPLQAVSSFTGTLLQDSSLSRDSRTVLRVSLASIRSDRSNLSMKARGRVLVIVTGDYRFPLGQKLIFQAKLGPAPTGGRESSVAFVKRGDIRSLGFSRPIWELRARARESIHRSIGLAGFPASALLEALLVGGREDIPASLTEGFRKTGSTHILALSGLHAAVIFGFISLILRFTSSRPAKYLLGVMGLLLFQLIAGPLPSLLRATLMLVIGGAALLLDRDGEPINILALSGIVILAVDPFQAGDLSFQLSYLALFGLLAAAPLFVRGGAGWIPMGVLATVSLSAAAQLATFPVVITAFGEYYPSGLIASLVLVPLTTVFLWMGLFWLIVSPLIGPLVHYAAAAAFNGLYDAISGCAGALSGFPALRVESSVAPWAALAAFVGFLVLCLLPLRPPAGKDGEGWRTVAANAAGDAGGDRKA